jgi:ABC-type polysaccharide/polyol phosphate export permease
VPWSTLWLVVPGTLLVLLNLSWIALIVGPICTRFRDFPPIITNLLQMFFFITPIVFKPESLERARWIIHFNPFSYMVQAIRGPLLGQGLALDSVIALGLTATVGGVAALLFFARFRQRIAFWL